MYDVSSGKVLLLWPTPLYFEGILGVWLDPQVDGFNIHTPQAHDTESDVI